MPVINTYRLKVNETIYLVVFTHVDADTYCVLTWERRGRRYASSGIAYCNPKDTFDASLGERVAMSRACEIGVRSIWREFEDDDLHQVYSLFREAQRRLKECS